MQIDRLIAQLEAKAKKLGLTKRELAQMAEVHPNSLRHFRAHGARSRQPSTTWSPTMAVLRKVEGALQASQPRQTT